MEIAMPASYTPDPRQPRAGEQIDSDRAAWTRRTGYVAQGGSWCICHDGTCRVCEAQHARCIQLAPQPDAGGDSTR